MIMMGQVVDIKNCRSTFFANYFKIKGKKKLSKKNHSKKRLWWYYDYEIQTDKTKSLMCKPSHAFDLIEIEVTVSSS